MTLPPASRLTLSRTAYALMWLALFIPYSYFNHSDGWNQGARLAELHAVVLKGTRQIDAYTSYTGDLGLIDGHYYNEKAPAMVVAALPAFTATVGLQRLLGLDPDATEPARVSAWISTVFSVSLLTALGGVAFFALLLERFPPVIAVLGTYGLFLGTITFPYATALFAHAGTIGLLSIALCGALGSTPRRDIVAGVAAGFAVASEYPAVFPCAVIGLYLGTKGLGRMWRFGLATLPAAALILLNNYAISGTFFALGYGANPNFPAMNVQTNFGFGMPKPDVMLALLVGEHRGMLFWSPVLALSAVGFVDMFKTERATAIMTMAACVTILLQVAAFYTPFGGNAVGPRYLAPAIPFFGLAAAYGIKRMPEMGLILVILSMGLMLTVTAIAIDPNEDVLTPFRSFYVVRIEQERWADNLGTLIGMPLWLSLAVPITVPAIAAWRILKGRRGVAQN